MFSIYGLVDPRDQKIRYVGKTGPDLDRRLRQHILEAGRGEVTHRHNWLRELISCGHTPGIVLLEEVAEDWQAAERAWIAALPDLTNQRRGGDGVPIAAVRAQAERARGIRRDPRIGERVSAAKRGQPARPGAADHLPKAQPGEGNLQAKLSFALVVALRRHARAGGETAAWARAHGVTSQAAHYAKVGATWACVDSTEPPLLVAAKNP